jgi:hypothetical protein
LGAMAELPPDLEALGDALTRATTRAAAVRRRRIDVRRKLALCVAAGVVVFAATTPSRLGADHVQLLQRFAAAPAIASGYDGCDRPRGHAGYIPQSCDAARLQPQAAR